MLKLCDTLHFMTQGVLDPTALPLIRLWNYQAERPRVPAPAEIAAARDARERGHSVIGSTLYSTLEPCSFHGRTPACATSIAERGVARVVIGIRDPHPRVNGAGTLILRHAGVEVIEGVCESEVRRQLALWELEHHPHESLRRAQELPEPRRVALLAEIYGVDHRRIEALFARHLPGSASPQS